LSAQELFTLLDSNDTGIDFNNAIEDLRECNILLYSNYYGGAGVGIADLDNDGLQDLYFPGNLVDDKIYKNLGDLEFEDKTASAGIVNDGAWSSSVVFGDVNNDGLLDIYVTCELYDDQPDLRRNKLYINQGDFKFSEQAEQYGLDDNNRSRGATFIDFDKDGWLDIYVLNQPPNPGNYSAYSGQDLLQYKWGSRLYRNNGLGKFIDLTLMADVGRPSYPNAVVAADIDGDGWQDLYVSNDYEAPDFYYRNNKDGTFTNIIDQAMRHISYYAMGVDAADINNDGHLDLMTLDMVAEDNYRLKRNMSGMQPELFWKLVAQGAHYQYMFNALHLKQGKDLFSDIAQLAGVSSTDWSWSNVIADFDNDGWKDIYITNGLLKDIRNTDMKKTFTKFVEQSIKDYLMSHPNEGDVDVLDVIDIQKGMDLHPSVPLKNYAYRNRGDLTFENSTTTWGFDQESFSNGCAYADLDNDGDLDLVVSNINDKAFLYKNNSDLSANFLRLQLKHEDHKSIQGAKVKIYAGELFQFSEVANSRGMYSSSENIVHFGLGDLSTIDSLSVQWPDGRWTKKYDLKANQLLNIYKDADTEEAPNNLSKSYSFEAVSAQKLGLDFKHTENNFDDYDKQVLLPHEMSHLGPASAIADVNGDQLDDIFIGGASGQSSVLYLQTKDGEFRASYQDWIQDQNYEDVAAAFFDADGDDDLDLYVVSGGNAFSQRNKNYLDRFYLNDGQGLFTKAANRIPRILESGACVNTIDFDNDGDLDLFVGGRHVPWDYPSPPISRLLENEDGYFTDVTKTKASALINIGMVTGATAQDYNNDGLVDLIIVGEWMPITFLKNSKNGFEIDNIAIKSMGKEVLTNGWWNTIHEADIDDDGDMDYVVGNLGKNYKYKASQSEPFSVHYYDFDESGQKDIVLSYYNFGEKFPLRGRSCSAEQIPDIGTEFASYDLFASLNLEDVYQPQALDQALNYDAHMFESVMLIAEENGSFTIEYLANEAQLSCINTIQELDVDQDGISEIIVAGNMYQSEIETPRNDASVGAVLKRVGSQEGSQWTALNPSLTNLYLPHDVRAIHPITIAGKRCLFVVSNDDPIRIVQLVENE